MDWKILKRIYIELEVLHEFYNHQHDEDGLKSVSNLLNILNKQLTRFDKYGKI